jgi:hypothetical protein
MNKALINKIDRLINKNNCIIIILNEELKKTQKTYLVISWNGIIESVEKISCG